MKNRDILLDVIGETDEALIPALKAKEKKRPRILLTAIGSVCAAAMIGGIILMPKLKGGSEKPQTNLNGQSEQPARNGNMLLAQAAYPEMPQYPDEAGVNDWKAFDKAYDQWSQARNALRNQPEGYQDGFDVFFANSVPVFLRGAGHENRVYSPLSLYMALGMSAEITDGNTRQQILDVLAQNDLKTLRQHAKSVWQANYADDGMAKCVLASSLWTNQFADYRQNTLDALAEQYYASVYSGDPTDAAYNQVMRDWMNQQTDGLLEDYVSDIKMDPQMLLTLATTVNYSGKWNSPFDKACTDAGTFRTPDGDVSCEYMHAEKITSYYWGEHYSAVTLNLERNGEMRLILPDEGMTPEQLLSDPETGSFLLAAQSDIPNQKFLIVNMTVPKFDVSSATDLKEGMQALGITDIFEAGTADFSPLTRDADGVYLSTAKQDARVLIDEEGCKAAALTVMMYAGGGCQDEHVDFVLDRPFLFEIVSDSGMPLFVGIVNNPGA